MEKIKIKCPAKINLTLEVVNKRPDGFHNIKSIMQMISLYDFLTISIEHGHGNKISLSGTSDEIPYNEKNLVYKAADLYLKTAEIKDSSVNIFIEKNIPVAAGLAGGSTDASGTILGLNCIFKKFNHEKLEEMCSELGSDLNVCLNGGCTLATSRGEITTKLPCAKYPVTLIKPKNLGISAKEAYTKYSEKEFKPQNNMTEKMVEALKQNKDIKEFLYNDLEYAVFDDYIELQKIKKEYPEAVMSGSGSTYFVLKQLETKDFAENYMFIKNLAFIENGVEVIEEILL